MEDEAGQGRAALSRGSELQSQSQREPRDQEDGGGDEVMRIATT